jgi:hypothetical protein
MSVSIADMERVALGGAPDDIGNVIELGDLNDDLGLSMLANPNKISVSHASSDSGSRTVSINNFAPSAPAPAPSADTFGGIDVSPLEPIALDAAPIDMGSFGAPPVEVNVVREAAPPAKAGFFGGLFGNSQSSTAAPAVSLAAPARDPEAEKKEKSDYLNKLQRLEQKGFPVARKFTMDNNLEEIKTEYYRLVDARQLETSIKFQRQMLMGAITGLEWLNGRFDPFDLKLDGWSEQVHENVEDFDEIFEELYDKYKDRGKMSPEMRLIMAVGGSGFMCHVSNSFFRSKMPSMDDVLKKNPELARQMAAAAAQSAGPGFGNFMGAALGVQPPSVSQQPPPGFPTNAGPAPFGPTPSPATPTPNTGAFFGASAASPMEMPAPQPPQPPRATARREMTGPTGVEDILRTFEEVSRAEMAAASLPQPATGFATQPAVAAAMNSAASVISAEEMMSQADTARTGATSGRRRRRAQPPVGNTIALNV